MGGAELGGVGVDRDTRGFGSSGRVKWKVAVSADNESDLGTDIVVWDDGGRSKGIARTTGVAKDTVPADRGIGGSDKGIGGPSGIVVVVVVVNGGKGRLVLVAIQVVAI